MINLPHRGGGGLTLEDGAGICVIQGCKVKGGLLTIRDTVEVERLSERGAELPLWDGKAVVICGDHLREILGRALSVG